MLVNRSDAVPNRVQIEDADRAILYGRVAQALSAIQSHFKSPINIEGIDATDLFSMNTLLGSAIEVHTVEALRSMRAIWDPDGSWAGYDFVRYPQSFPDVRLVSTDGKSSEPAIGIELKSWYLLSKEAEPSFRFKTTADACAPWDLFAVVPWSLSNVLSGTPVIYRPFIEQAKHVAHMRNHYWLNTRVGGVPKDDDSIDMPDDVSPYPAPNSVITDRPLKDSGGNFGRIGRVHDLVGTWTAECLQASLAGIPAQDWVKFLRAHTESISGSATQLGEAGISVRVVRETAYAMIEMCDKVD